MYKSFSTICVCFLILFLSRCKKFDEGGKVFRSKFKLLGSNSDGARKSWGLKKFVVNGIDSTTLIKGPSKWPTYYSEYVIFYRENNDDEHFRSSTYLYEYYTSFDSIKKKRILTFSDMNYYKTYKNQFGVVNGDAIHCRNLFCPEEYLGHSNWHYNWTVKKLTDSELIMELKLKNHYRIELAH